MSPLNAHDERPVRVAVTLPCYNDETRIHVCLESILQQKFEQRPVDLFAFVTDDGSSDRTPEILKKYAQAYPNINISLQPHKERGAARLNSISNAMEINPDYLLIIDSDMSLKTNCVEACLETVERKNAGALIVPEMAYSNSRNFMTQVKVFERNILNNAGEEIDVETSIEAARFWETRSFMQTGGFHKDQIAFEEIQPTIRYREQGGTVARTVNTCIFHDEKHVTLKAILDKKRYYFSKLHITASTESNGFGKMWSRWYFFRPVLYRPDNLKRYLLRPDLAIGMFFMYVMLTWVAVLQYTKQKGLAVAS